MRVTANGRGFDLEGPMSVSEFVRARGLDPRHVVVERNGEPLERARYEDTILADGDRLELVRAVAGGAGEKGMRAGTGRERLRRSRLYLVTGARMDRGDLGEFLERILEAGVDIIQLREKDAEAGDLLRWGETFREAAGRHDALFIVNDRPDVAAAVDADGVHLGQNDLPPAVARDLLGPEAIVGLSTHDRHQWDAAAREADYLCAGPVWETPTKAGRPAAGLDHVRYSAKSEERRPWFAIGGINSENLAQVVEAGASRIVVVRAITEATDPAAAVKALVAGLPAV